MKMHKDHYNELATLIAAIVYRPEYDHDVSEKRKRWDLLWSIPYTERELWFRENDIYGYLDDTHIDTALRNIVK